MRKLFCPQALCRTFLNFFVCFLDDWRAMTKRIATDELTAQRQCTGPGRWQVAGKGDRREDRRGPGGLMHHICEVSKGQRMISLPLSSTAWSGLLSGLEDSCGLWELRVYCHLCHCCRDKTPTVKPNLKLQRSEGHWMILSGSLPRHPLQGTKRSNWVPSLNEAVVFLPSLPSSVTLLSPLLLIPSPSFSSLLLFLSL